MVVCRILVFMLSFGPLELSQPPSAVLRRLVNRDRDPRWILRTPRDRVG